MFFVGPNRAGKTSLADALAAALFGPDRPRSTSPLAKADLQTWRAGRTDTGADGAGERHRAEFRTAVELETGEGRFRLERDLESGRAALHMGDGDGWRLQTAENQEISAWVKKITGIDRADLFLATAYLRQGDLARIAESGNLERMGELLRAMISGAPQADVSDILATLRSAQRDVKPEGTKGHRPVNPREYDRLLVQRDEVRDRIARTQETYRVVLSLSERKIALEKTLPENQRRLEEVTALLDRWKRKTALEKEKAEAVAEADGLNRRLRRLQEIRETLIPAREALREIGDMDGLSQAVTERLPALRAERDAMEKRSAELRGEVSRIEGELKSLRKERARLERFGDQSEFIEEKLPLWEGALREDSRALPGGKKAGRGRGNISSVPSWGKIVFAMILFLLTVSTPVIYWAVRGEAPLYLAAFLGLGFPVLLWAVLLLNRRLLINLRTGRREGDAGGGTSPGSRAEERVEDPQEGLAGLLRSLGVETADGARAGLRGFRDTLSALKSLEDLHRRAEGDLEKSAAVTEKLNEKIQTILDRFHVDHENGLIEAHNRAHELLRRREDLTAREKELLAEGSEEDLAARLDDADRRRRDLSREFEEGGFDLFHPSSSEVETWRGEHASLSEAVDKNRTELIRIRTRLEEKTGEGFPSVETLQERLDEIEGRLRRLDLLHRAYGVAVETLEESVRELEESYLPRLERGVEDHFRSVIGRDFGIDLTTRWPAVTVALPDHPEAEPRNLSRGTADQLFLALRVACLELLGGEEPLPLILDDPFVHYDDATLERALDWLARMAARTQIIFLAAREAYVDWAERSDVAGKAKVFRLGSAATEV
ncbi:MAG: AAA family ATPase [Nitrospinota bacterium]|nr:AAA family ATPase [Nitrospinota bacterium]